ncbi:hypothetical protein [Haloarcula sp. 1CSR25-25]|uniref:hypothetical protein n=1 Tax=Haloarcula sp. 1CSR25-25 TaxID=2862545 RepID=UPI002895B1D0|nr:hypothetical protein [Haloarcula sp. 1CSR25-25]MDT3436059.1 hypothetical protein [Haloarcula sp. 1CSR25-25]
MGLADALTARITGNDVGITVWLLVDSTRGLIGLAEYFVAGSTVRTVILTDVFAAPIAGFQMFRSEFSATISALCCMVQTTDFVGIIGGGRVCRAKRLFTDCTESVVLGAHRLIGMSTRVLVVAANDAITVRAVSNEVDTVGFLALCTRI